MAAPTVAPLLARVNGIELAYQIHGRGKPLVLLHGGFGSVEMFGPNVAALAAGRQVIGVDLQSHGRTPALRPSDALRDDGRRRRGAHPPSRVRVVDLLLVHGEVHDPEVDLVATLLDRDVARVWAPLEGRFSDPLVGRGQLVTRHLFPEHIVAGAHGEAHANCGAIVLAVPLARRWVARNPSSASRTRRYLRFSREESAPGLR
ncbi:MAG: alpha/beta fold hydrolase [Candidatus Limnocylindrales bacterium]